MTPSASASLRRVGKREREMERVLTKIAVWLEGQVKQSEAEAVMYERFPTVVDACRRDGKNFAAVAKKARSALAVLDARGGEGNSNDR